MDMKAAEEAEATVRATMKATVRPDRLAWPPQRALPPEAVMPEELAAQAGPTWAISAQDLAAQTTTRAARLLMVYEG
jgi:hypothetical protein